MIIRSDAPGVFALRPDTGLVNLGVPVGTDAYVTATVEESVRKHDTRLRKLVELALHATDATKSCGRNLGRMSARLGLRYAASNDSGAQLVTQGDT